MQNGRIEEIEAQALKFRQSCSKTTYGLANIFADCTKHGFKLLRLPAAEGPLGFSLKMDGDTIIFTNSAVRLSREIFTLAHEIGHATLHLQSSALFRDDESNLGKSVNPAEQEANCFAACLLMPEKETRDFLQSELKHRNMHEFAATDIARLMSEFSVSFEMALNRLETFGLITAALRTKLNNAKTIESVGKLLKVTGGNQKLNEVSNCTEIPSEYLDYAIYNYNCGAVSKESFEKVLEYYGLTQNDIKDRLTKTELHDDFNASDIDRYIKRFQV